MSERLKTWLADPVIDHFRNSFSGFGEKFTADLFDILVILAIVGAFMNMSGSKTWGRRLAGGSILAGLICRAVFYRA